MFKEILCFKMNLERMIKFCCGGEIIVAEGKFCCGGEFCCRSKVFFEKDLTSNCVHNGREKFSLQSLQLFSMLRIPMY